MQLNVTIACFAEVNLRSSCTVAQKFDADQSSGLESSSCHMFIYYKNIIYVDLNV